MAEIFLVIADGSAGKSATVRALTGARSFGAFPVEIGTPRSVEECFIEIRSIQESGRYETTAKLISAIRKSKCQIAILTLRQHSYNGYPGAQTYIDAFHQAGWPIAGVCEIALSNIGLNYHGPVNPVLTQPQYLGGSANKRASAVRKKWPIS